MDYHLTQFLSEYEHFRVYLKQFDLSEEDTIKAVGDSETVKHAVLYCYRWKRERTNSETLLCKKLSVEIIQSVAKRPKLRIRNSVSNKTRTTEIEHRKK